MWSYKNILSDVFVLFCSFVDDIVPVTRKMSVFQEEKYSNDLFEAIMDNMKKKSLLKDRTCVWGLNNPFLSWKENRDCLQTEREKMPEKVFIKENISTSSCTISKGDKNEQPRDMGIPLNHEDNRRSPKSFSVEEDIIPKNVKLNEHIDTDCGKISQKHITNGIHRKELVDRDRLVSRTENEIEFSNCCMKRQKEHNSNSKLTSQHTECNQRLPGKRIRPKSKSPESETRKASSNVNARQKYSKSMTQLNSLKNVIKTQVCIKIMDERKEKSQEFTVDILDLSRITRYFPKLKEVLPEVDAGIKTVQFSIEAIIFILRFALFRRYSKDELPSATVGVEILAAVKTWEINELQNLFLKDFLEKTLPSSNANLVFSQASHYGLNNIRDYCKEIAVDGISRPCSTYQRKQKTCFITISTYIEPLEFSIPFYPIEENFELSFERHICNTVRFQAVSHLYTIIGIHLQLNANYLEKCSNLNNLKIDYTTKNVSEDREIETGRCEKPMRQLNIIYFRNPLVVNPKQIVEITVEIDTKPYLCSAFPKDKELQKKVRDKKFLMEINSDFKLPKSGHNLYIIGKLLYNVQELPNSKRK